MLSINKDLSECVHPGNVIVIGNTGKHNLSKETKEAIYTDYQVNLFTMFWNLTLMMSVQFQPRS